MYDTQRRESKSRQMRRQRTFLRVQSATHDMDRGKKRKTAGEIAYNKIQYCISLGRLKRLRWLEFV